MKPALLISVALVLAACTPAPNNPSRTSAGVTEIAISDGRNCWNNRCLTFSSLNRSIQVTSKHPVSVPRNIDLRDGYVTEAEFSSMFTAANRALSRGVGRR